jgi:hypothetical protein
MINQILKLSIDLNVEQIFLRFFLAAHKRAQYAFH